MCATPAAKSYNSLTLSPLCPREMEARLGASGTSRIFGAHLSGNTGSAPTNRAVRGAIRRSAALNCLRVCHNRETLCRALFHSQRQPFWLLHSPSNTAAGRFGSRSTPLALGNFLQSGVTTAISNRLGPAGRGRVAYWTIVTRNCGPLLRSIPGHSVESVRQRRQYRNPSTLCLQAAESRGRNLPATCFACSPHRWLDRRNPTHTSTHYEPHLRCWLTNFEKGPPTIGWSFRRQREYEKRRSIRRQVSFRLRVKVGYGAFDD